MRDDKKLKIEQLAASDYEKSEIYRMLGMSKTPSDPVEKKQCFINYAIARGEMIEANRALKDALNGGLSA